MSARPARGWWRRNAVALGLVVVLAPALSFAVLGHEWAEHDQGSFTQPIEVAPGTFADYAGASVGPADARFDDTIDTPSGTRALAVTVRIDPGDGGFACNQPALFEQGGAQRQWNLATLSLDLPSDADRVTYCDSTATAPYELALYYLLPDDAAGPFTVQVADPSAMPRYASVVVSP